MAVEQQRASVNAGYIVRGDDVTIARFRDWIVR